MLPSVSQVAATAGTSVRWLCVSNGMGFVFVAPHSSQVKVMTPSAVGVASLVTSPSSHTWSPVSSAPHPAQVCVWVPSPLSVQAVQVCSWSSVVVSSGRVMSALNALVTTK